jgi:hypothetical protein
MADGRIVEVWRYHEDVGKLAGHIRGTEPWREARR